MGICYLITNSYVDPVNLCFQSFLYLLRNYLLDLCPDLHFSFRFLFLHGLLYIKFPQLKPTNKLLLVGKDPSKVQLDQFKNRSFKSLQVIKTSDLFI